MNQELVDIKITGIDEEMSAPVDGTRLFDINFLLSNAPPEEWRKIFDELWHSHPHLLKYRARIEGYSLVITAAPEEIESRFRDQIDQLLASANEEYRDTLGLGQMTAEERATREEQNRSRLRSLGERLGYSISS